MKKILHSFLLAGTLGLGAAAAQAHGPMMGQSSPGMMGHHGYGPGMMGSGAMGSYGMMQPGMMGGYGPGMMMGPGMMGGCDPSMMGSGMPGGYGVFTELDPQQHQQLSKIHNDLCQEQQPLMQQLHQRMQELYSLSAQADADPKAVGDKYAQVFALRQQMTQNMRKAQQQMQQVFNKQG